MPDNASAEHRLARLINERRLDLGLRWDQLADAVGVTEVTLRTMRRTNSVPRELNERGLELALGWTPGSVARVLAGGEPELPGEEPAVPGDSAPVLVLRSAITAFETAVLDSGLTPDEKRDMIGLWRTTGAAELLARYRRPAVRWKPTWPAG
jgi:hypothetical protein